ncbi:MAG: GTPase ObgE [Egibacteraceae bacterium]
MFIDEVQVHVKGGRGGDGVTSFARQPYEPRGRPDGGDGGHGGSVIVRATSDVATLVDYHHRPHRVAGRGRHGQGDLRRGADGEDVILAVPVGTVVRTVGGEPRGAAPNTVAGSGSTLQRTVGGSGGAAPKAAEGELIADLVRPGDEVVAASGGRGGRGNAAFRTARRLSPSFHERGEPPEERWIVLELKLAADVGLVGFPNAGKSSLISRLSAARPKIAEYPFTTLVPNLGVVRALDPAVDFVVADVPGLIEGASEGRGLGHRFLRHVERAGVLVHVLDCASDEQRDPREDLAKVLAELRAWQPDLVERPALVFCNKADADPDTAELVREDLVAQGWEALVGSAVTGLGLDRLRHRLAQLVTQVRADAAVEGVDLEAARPVLRPAGGNGFTVEATGRGFRVTGDRVERWVAMTDLDNLEAVRYLQGRLLRAGVERELTKAGARRGDAVEIAGQVFDFEPERGQSGPDTDDEDLR